VGRGGGSKGVASQAAKPLLTDIMDGGLRGVDLLGFGGGGGSVVGSLGEFAEGVSMETRVALRRGSLKTMGVAISMGEYWSLGSKSTSLSSSRGVV
jgi:hypothetical protein